ncbi:Crp/Fnr family transcriptional regulator [Marinobacter sp.]|uniref:Crp/Fnr family transcriptional regulator n=1 Tax=Marinobacter sp. TaxID=50741 RepID=UPI00384AA6DD
MGTSCIIRHFEHYAELTQSDRDLLASLERSPESSPKNTVLWEQGAPSEFFYTVSRGWAVSYRNMENGTRQVLDIYVPGDIIGLREFAFQKRVAGLMVLTDAELCAFPKMRLTEVFSKSILLCSIFFMITARDQAILLERLVNLGRRSAKEKLAHFLVEMCKRLGKTNPAVANELKLPLTQALIADALGLSAVHVSRTFQELKETGQVGVSNGGIEVHDIEGLKEIAGFDPSYLEEDIDAILEHSRRGEINN